MMNHWSGKITLLNLLLIVTFGCSPQRNDTPSMDYSSSDLWFELPTNTSYSVDVFYVLPTCTWDWTDSSGAVCHYADLDNPEHREAMQGSYELAKEIFAQGQCNFFAPYYRQISLESWIEGDSVVSERFPLAMMDIQAAFNEFIANKNEGRPFILAGFSQGGKGVVELLKGLSSEQYNQLIAAYVIGYRVTEEELTKYSTIQEATESNDTGVTICYNSVASAQSICEVLSPSALCINPINWKTDATTAMMNDTVTVSIDTQNKVLLVEGLDQEQYYLPILSDLFSLGNYHLQELSFYQDNLTENVSKRISSYNEK